MHRTPNLMKGQEREIDYLSRLTVDSESTNKSTKEIEKHFVDFVIKHDIELNGQSGIRYVNFRESGFQKSVLGGFGSRTLLGKILIDCNFNIDNYSKKIINTLLSIYDKINYELQIKEECFTFSLKENYKTLEDIEYLEFVYHASIMTYEKYKMSSCYYPDCRIVVKQYLNNFDEMPVFSVFDGQIDSDGHLVISAKSNFDKFDDILKPFISEHKDLFCEKYNLDVSVFDDNLNTIIQMMEL